MLPCCHGVVDLKIRLWWRDWLAQHAYHAIRAAAKAGARRAVAAVPDYRYLGGLFMAQMDEQALCPYHVLRWHPWHVDRVVAV